MRSNRIVIQCASVALTLLLAEAQAAPQAPLAPPPAAPAPAESGMLVGPAAITPHWSKYSYPQSIPEGASYYIIAKGDTLWDLARKFLGNPYLWPQLWDQNKYVTDAHWIYPGDPLTLPKVALVSERAGEAQTETPSETPRPILEPGVVLDAPIQEMALQCAEYVVTDSEDQSLYVIGSENGSTKLDTFADRDIVYLSKGSNAGVKTGDVYALHHPLYQVKHPVTGKNIGRKVQTTGWASVILVQETSATAVIDRACLDIHLGDYLTPFERVSVPLIPRRAAVTRLIPPSGKVKGFVVDIADNSFIAGTHSIVTLDLGSANGLAPGNVLVAYKIMYPTVPTSRVVVGELAVVAVRERTATAAVLNSRSEMLLGDEVELQ